MCMLQTYSSTERQTKSWGEAREGGGEEGGGGGGGGSRAQFSCSATLLVCLQSFEMRNIEQGPVILSAGFTIVIWPEIIV